MKIYKNKSLKKLNTFRVECVARYFTKVKNDEDIRKAISFASKNEMKILTLGGGSNVLLTGDFDGLVVKNEVMGYEVTKDTNEYVDITIGAGEEWHKFVRWAVNNAYFGIENLALIPGTCGAAPVQNIAAYGQNLSDTFIKLKAFDIKSKKFVILNKKDCEFGYRTSIFKMKKDYIISNITLRLLKGAKLETSYYMMGISYTSIKDELEKYAKEPYTPKDIFNAVTRIRINKLPNWKKFPTIGSFFLNPIVTVNKLKKLQKIISELQYYPLDQLTYPDLSKFDLNNQKYVKIPAGRLLDELGWRGKRIGNCWMHDKHALILVTNGKASGKEILGYANMVRDDCYQKFKVKLESEVCIV